MATLRTLKVRFYKCCGIKVTNGHSFPIHKEVKKEKFRRLKKF